MSIKKENIEMANCREKYKFIIAGRTGELYDYVYRDTNILDYARFDSGIPVSPLLKFIMRVHLSKKVNNILSMPFKNVWGRIWIKHWKKLLKNINLDNRSVCFILFADMIPFEEYGLTQDIRKAFPQAKIVYFYQDLVARDKNKLKPIQEKSPDLIMSFDYGDAEKYNLVHHNFPYSKLRNDYANQELDSDVCFIGRAKDRLEEIIDAYVFFSEQGLRCDFYIIDVPNDRQKYSDKIHYCEPMDYDSYLKKIAKSKSVLEIMQGGGSGNTIRINEVIEFNKILITNNEKLSQSVLYDSRYMFSYHNVHELDCKKIQQINHVSYDNREMMSIENFLEDVAKNLEGK